MAMIQLVQWENVFVIVLTKYREDFYRNQTVLKIAFFCLYFLRGSQFSVQAETGCATKACMENLPENLGDSFLLQSMQFSVNNKNKL